MGDKQNGRGGQRGGGGEGGGRWQANAHAQKGVACGKGTVNIGKYIACRDDNEGRDEDDVADKVLARVGSAELEDLKERVTLETRAKLCKRVIEGRQPQMFSTRKRARATLLNVDSTESRKPSMRGKAPAKCKGTSRTMTTMTDATLCLRILVVMLSKRPR